MKKHLFPPRLTLWLCGALACASAGAQSWTVESPDGRLSLRLYGGERLACELILDDRELLGRSPISMTIDGGVTLGLQPTLIRQQRRAARDTLKVPVPFKRQWTLDHYNELTLWFEGGYGLCLRAADDGAAYRFFTELPDSLLVYAEEAAFHFSVRDTAYFALMDCAGPARKGVDCFHTSFEEVYVVLPLEEIRDTQMAFLPALIARPDGLKILITEADLDDYPGMFLTGAGPGTAALIGRFAPYPLEERLSDDYYAEPLVVRRAEYIARVAGARRFPWRVIIPARRDADLLLNDWVYRLGSDELPPEIPWFLPGKSQSEWIIDNNLYWVDFRAGYNTDTYRYYIDYAAHFGLEYVMFDAGWSAIDDLFSITPGMDMEYLIGYAREKDIKVKLWTSAPTLERQLSAALDQFQRWGVSGIMVDFMNRDDQRMVNFYRRVAEETDKRKMFVNYHGAYKPTGAERRFPNMATREGVVAFEWNKWSDKLTPEYEVTVPFIRMVAGPLDYEPGNMRNAQREEFHPVNRTPLSQGTRIHQLAMFVVYESPFAKVVAHPSDAYREPEFTRFMVGIPTVWARSGALDARLADYVLLWRETLNGDYYVAAMTDWSPRKLRVDFSFLPEGTYQAIIYEDGINADRYAADYRRREILIASGALLDIELAPGGGWVARLSKWAP
jgi:alpha-glucosidase